MKVSVIMPSYLGYYDGAAMNREEKFFRAVESFVGQTYQDKELIIVSDGCENTIHCASMLSEEMGLDTSQIKLFKVDKQPLFSGNVRDYGLKMASGKVIAYLDTDDFFVADHLESIMEQFGNNDWVYFNDHLQTQDDLTLKVVELEHGRVGTSSIAHRKGLANWYGCDGYGHDWMFVQRLMESSKKVKKISGCGYVICHIPNISET